MTYFLVDQGILKRMLKDREMWFKLINLLFLMGGEIMVFPFGGWNIPLVLVLTSIMVLPCILDAVIIPTMARIQFLRSLFLFFVIMYPLFLFGILPHDTESGFTLWNVQVNYREIFTGALIQLVMLFGLALLGEIRIRSCCRRRSKGFNNAQALQIPARIIYDLTLIEKNLDDWEDCTAWGHAAGNAPIKTRSRPTLDKNRDSIEFPSRSLVSMYPVGRIPPSSGHTGSSDRRSQPKGAAEGRVRTESRERLLLPNYSNRRDSFSTTTMDRRGPNNLSEVNFTREGTLG